MSEQRSPRTGGHEVGVEGPSSFPESSPGQQTQVTRLPVSASESLAPNEVRSTYHIYIEKENHRSIVTTLDLSKESFRSQAKKKARKEKEDAEPNKVHTETEETDVGFFLHSPYLAFHDPPKVLYRGTDKHGTPLVLIDQCGFWRKYKLQLGPSIGIPGVIDSRGVVCWKHNGGDKRALKADPKKLKGYKVRTWRLWGESGKTYVRGVRANRKAGLGPDPDALEDTRNEEGGKIEPARAEEVVYLKWERPFSRHTRRYHFHYAGINFYWKGTKTVKKSGMCGFFLRFNHLKLVAKPPDQPEVLLAQYTSSVSEKKCGRLELFDGAILRLVHEFVQPISEIGVEEEEALNMKRLKETSIYPIIVATAMCMITAEKEKRKMVRELLQEGGEGGGG